ncbi:hypothetical protein [Burkholderia cenocepacia]|uniref:hypothetical protein n=1 Tax=Burkholderia cenocepacia TaxID=95486 RepID=UPI000B15E38C|nr:hypothetical protein [Burkholderia cenocepacia]MBR7979208.1 hypothetical protein [Burkholderia cenocepacia]MBR7993489.1 hypothetical protein [Burkholderia cenocepacia]
MQSVPVYRFWQFGTTVRYLQDVREGYKIKGSGNVLVNVDALFLRLRELELRVTINAADKLEEFRKELGGSDDDVEMTQAQSSKLRGLIFELRRTMEAELKLINAYTISPKRLDVAKLTDDIEHLFAPGVYQSLTDVAKYDISEAGRCIAFERPTAAAFHLMRATEEVLRGYYCFYVRRNRIDKMLWYPMIQALQQHRRAKVNDVLHRQLDNIRVSFRNPTQHPDKMYDIQEVQDLFGLCVDVINRMQKICVASGS